MSLYLEDDAVQLLLDLMESGRAGQAHIQLRAWALEQQRLVTQFPQAREITQELVGQHVSVEEDPAITPAADEHGGCWVATWMRLTAEDLKL